MSGAEPGWLGTSTLVCAAFALGAAATQAGSAWSIGAGATLLALMVATVRQRHQSVARRLGTASVVLEALRQRDYSQRARLRGDGGPIDVLMREINALSEHLERERTDTEESGAMLRAVVEHVDVALLAFDDAGVLRLWNPAAKRSFPRLANGTSPRELGMEDWLSGPAERSVRLPGDLSEAEFELRRGVFYRNGRRYQVVLLASLQRVRRREERAAWQRLLRVLGHEVNNTLAPVHSLAATCSHMLEDDGASAVPAVRDALEVIGHRAQSLTHFIGEFSRLARLPVPRPTRLELRSLIERLAALDNRCPVRVVEGAELSIEADGPLLEQALINLIRNAVDASEATGGAVSIEYRAENDSAVVHIIDDGLGIANPDNLFVPLFSTKPGGSGIGLVLARNIIEAHGGEVRLQNRAQRTGCSVRVSLPLTSFAAPGE
jgi:nitrogen fixation/metabolism regulation signal transduction histidine kinase